MIHAFGDSFVLGDQDDFRDNDIDFNASRTEYLKYNVSFCALIAQHFGEKFNNNAVKGTGNYPQLDLLVEQLISKYINKNDIVLYGLTTTIRDRVSVVFKQGHNPLYHSNLIDSGQVIDSKDKYSDLLMFADQLYVLSTLTQLSKIFEVRIIKFNLFDNSINQQIQIDDYLGDGKPGSTLVDILNDTWLQLEGPKNKQAWVRNGYEKFFTHKKHPSVLGHEKIAEWFLTNINFKYNL